jgi:hypothetical protein
MKVGGKIKDRKKPITKTNGLIYAIIDEGRTRGKKRGRRG